MIDTLRKLASSLQSGRAFAYCRLVETRGSTPQKAGAVMLVHGDGSQDGTLGGGCVEAEVKRRAIQIIANGQSELATFKLDSDYGWDDGLICGGRMKILIVPLGEKSTSAYYERLAELAESTSGATEAIAFDAESTSLPVPSSYLFDGHGVLVASSVLAESSNAVSADLDRQTAIVEKSMKSISTRPRPYAAQGIAYLPILPRCRLLIVGGGHVGKAVSELAVDLDFDVTVVDDREDIVSVERFPRAEKRIAGSLQRVLPSIDIGSDTYCLIVTRGHNHDEKALYHLANRGARYVGMIGSRRKIRMIFDDLVAEGIPPEVLSRVHAPVGLDIGSQTVPEIAVSIVAELVAHRNLNGDVPARPKAVDAIVSQ